MSAEERKLYMLANFQSRAQATETNRETAAVPAETSVVETSAGEVGASVALIDIEAISPSPLQVRQVFAETTLTELANSIRLRGVLQPLLVRPLAVTTPEELAQGTARYELIAAERRWRAAQIAGLTRVPVIVAPISDRDALEVSIIENAQREDLNPLEEARAYQRLAEEFDLSQREIAEAIGKNRATVANAIRLLQLEARVLEYIESGQLSAGHGRALLMLKSPSEQYRMAKRAVEQQLSVHALERKISSADEVDEEEGEENDEFAEERSKLDKQRQKISEALNVERVSLRLDPQGRRVLNLVFESEAAWRRFNSRMRG